MKSPASLIPLTPAVFQILLSLTEGERHGYAIMQEVSTRTGGEMEMGPGTLYGSVKRMIRDGLIEETARRPAPELDDQRRRYYRLTDFGWRVARLEAKRLHRLVSDARAGTLLEDV